MRFVRATAIVATALLASCSGGKSGSGEASAVAKQLVGHWASRGNDNLYFGAADPGSKIGSYILVHPDGKSFSHRYKIESVDSSDRAIKTTLLFANGDSREETFVVSADGKTVETDTSDQGIEIRSLLTKVDDTTAP